MPNVLSLERYPLTLAQPAAAPLQPIRATQQLLPLLQLLIARRVVRVPVTEQRRLVALEALKLTLRGVDVALVVPEALVDFRLRVLRNVRFLQAHRIQDLAGSH